MPALPWTVSRLAQGRAIGALVSLSLSCSGPGSSPQGKEPLVPANTRAAEPEPAAPDESTTVDDAQPEPADYDANLAAPTSRAGCVVAEALDPMFMELRGPRRRSQSISLDIRVRNTCGARLALNNDSLEMRLEPPPEGVRFGRQYDGIRCYWPSGAIIPLAGRRHMSQHGTPEEGVDVPPAPHIVLMPAGADCILDVHVLIAEGTVARGDVFTASFTLTHLTSLFGEEPEPVEGEDDPTSMASFIFTLPEPWNGDGPVGPHQ